jgi:outer membrane protein assembly factor BamE (lipoprotein component of BamABCDE complex)
MSNSNSVKKYAKHVAVAALLFSSSALMGCATSGTKVTADQAAQFRRGSTTEAELIAKLGEPTATVHSANGTTVDTYVYARGTADAASYIPVVGLFAGGAKGSATTATFVFDSDKILKDYTTSSSTTHVKTGVLQ